eukprot:4481723-Pyramimonas_sp.AAC.1
MQIFDVGGRLGCCYDQECMYAQNIGYPRDLDPLLGVFELSCGVFEVSSAVLRPSWLSLRTPRRVGDQLEPSSMTSWESWRPRSVVGLEAPEAPGVHWRARLPCPQAPSAPPLI